MRKSLISWSWLPAWLWVLGFAAGVERVALGQAAVSVPGITEPIFDVTLSASVPGTIHKRPFKEGDFVRRGQVVVELDKRLEELTVDRRKLVADTLQTELAGDRKLFETTRSVSKEALDKKELEYKVAVVDTQTAEEQLRKRHVFAPMDGYITEYFLEEGEDCKEQQPVVRLVDPRRCHFVSNMEARLGYRLKTGQSVALEIEAGSGSVSVKGEVVFISPVVDPASGLMRVKVLFENADGKVRPGVAGRLILEGGQDGR